MSARSAGGSRARRMTAPAGRRFPFHATAGRPQIIVPDCNYLTDPVKQDDPRPTIRPASAADLRHASTKNAGVQRYLPPPTVRNRARSAGEEDDDGLGRTLRGSLLDGPCGRSPSLAPAWGIDYSGPVGAVARAAAARRTMRPAGAMDRTGRAPRPPGAVAEWPAKKRKTR